ncbi:MAG: hypothetical protein U9Q15_02680 [Patescibacteria group bacterium]|nr:hypothetical protein [Patescibacteria group bacterium]
MNYKDILLRAWTIIHNYEFLAWMNFVPVLLALIFNTFFLSYQ